MANAVKADCRTTYAATRHSGTRPLKEIDFIIIHDTEGGTAASIARYFASATAKGSTHLIVDDNNCYRTLRNNQVPWAAPGANYHGFHIEMCGYARWSTEEWLKHRTTIERAAYKTAFHCHLFNIPPKWIYASGLKAGAKGISSHLQCTKAFGGSHTDPGPGFPQGIFMTLVRRYHAELAGV